MFNINKVNTVYLACGVTDLRKSIDGLTMIVQNEMKLNPFDNVLFVFCNKQMNKLKINKEEFKWILKGYEVRTRSKFEHVTQKNYYSNIYYKMAETIWK